MKHYLVEVTDINCDLCGEQFLVEAANYDDACNMARQVADTFYDVPKAFYVDPEPMSDFVAEMTGLDEY